MMSGFIISVVAIVLLSTLIELFISEGETKKYIKGIVAILLVIVLLQPLISFIDKDFTINLDKNNQNNETELNKEYLERIYLTRYKNMEINLQKKLSIEGYKSVTVRIDIECNNYLVEIKKITINLKNLIIIGDKTNIDINKEIMDIVSKSLNVSEDKIKIDE